MRYDAFTLGVCALVAGMISPVHAARPQKSSLDDRAMAVARSLTRMVDKVAFDEEPLEDVLAWLRTAGLKNIVVRWRTIEDAGVIDRDTPVSLELVHMPLGEVLEWILADASQGVAPDDALRYHIERGVLVVSSRRDFATTTLIRVYDVEHLLQGRWFWSDAPEINVAEQAGQRAGSAGAPGGNPGGGGTILSGGDGEQDVDFQARRGVQVDALIQALYQLQPETWAIRGGSGTITFLNGRMIINQTHEVHEMIGGIRKANRDR